MAFCTTYSYANFEYFPLRRKIKPKKQQTQVEFAHERAGNKSNPRLENPFMVRGRGKGVGSQ
ncbi:hypothetical protein PL18_13245 [Vibrio renipiscarius]|uniref:Uncharacterized protein n=1 Tax=Vibrio renipiscarius TaxID=1461322 RepID=A0A0C2K7C2_9VIBR|nr:hypothetical protein OJ16_17325 [Vibrio renipiscarius]KII77933.1 hypothetical protein PL18_13245 [Vibrio renipiscarius]